MPDRPIPCAPSVARAIWAGRQTQDRRPITEKAALDALAAFGPEFLLLRGNADLLPFAVGDRLWVRERARVLNFGISGDLGLYLRYEADGTEGRAPLPSRIKCATVGNCLSMGCYREASRMTMLVTNVRVQRLQDISDEDAQAEGATMRPKTHGFMSRAGGWSMDWSVVGTLSRFAGGIHPRGHAQPLSEQDISLDCPRMAFASFWNSLYGSRPGLSWDDNPWVAATTFQVVRKNIDQMEE